MRAYRQLRRRIARYHASYNDQLCSPVRNKALRIQWKARWHNEEEYFKPASGSHARYVAHLSDTTVDTSLTQYIN